MKYCISDIHGEYDLFINLLKRINFKDDDELYILGDIIDKGNDSIKLLNYIFSLNNCYCILGNHEYEFLKYYYGLISRYENDEDIINKIKECFPNEKHLINLDSISTIISNIESMKYYIELDKFILVHAGVKVVNGKLFSLEDTKIEDFVYNRNFKDINYPVCNKCIIYGHTPVRYVNDEDRFIYYRNELNNANKYYKIHIDLGVYLSGAIGCLCLDNYKAYYIRRR